MTEPTLLGRADEARDERDSPRVVEVADGPATGEGLPRAAVQRRPALHGRPRRPTGDYGDARRGAAVLVALVGGLAALRLVTSAAQAQHQL